MSSSVTEIENPLRAGVRLERTAEPCVVVIFGATGDLTKRKLVPALYSLMQQRLLPAEFAVLGFSRPEMTDEEFRQMMRESYEEHGDSELFDEAVWNSFVSGLFYMHGDFADAEAFAHLRARLEQIDEERGTEGNRLFYLSTAPSFFGLIAEQLGKAGLNQGRGWTRLIVEKPFGYDLESARELNTQLARVFNEDQIYRIDHYLGKETVQNLLVFRFANSIFEPLWNRQYIDHVQFTNAEAIGVEGRGAYYEKAGVVRDMIQNHVFQVVSLIAMEAARNLERRERARRKD